MYKTFSLQSCSEFNLSKARNLCVSNVIHHENAGLSSFFAIIFKGQWDRIVIMKYKLLSDFKNTARKPKCEAANRPNVVQVSVAAFASLIPMDIFKESCRPVQPSLCHPNSEIEFLADRSQTMGRLQLCLGQPKQVFLAKIWQAWRVCLDPTRS